MSIRSKPIINLRIRNKRSQLRIFQHVFRREQQSIREVAGQDRRVFAPEHDLPQATIDPIGSDNKVHRERLSILERDGGILSPKRSLNVQDPSLRPDLRPQLNRPIKQTAMQIGPVKIPVKRPRILCRGGFKVHVRDFFAFPVEHIHSRRFGRILVQGFFQAPGLQHAAAVGEDLDAGADFADFACGFEDEDAVAGEEEGDGGADAA
jgi:hypothetical protein